MEKMNEQVTAHNAGERFGFRVCGHHDWPEEAYYLALGSFGARI